MELNELCIVIVLTTLGLCPFILIPAIEVTYNIYSNGGMMATLRCIDGETHYITCGTKEQWVNYLPYMCQQVSNMTTMDGELEFFV